MRYARIKPEETDTYMHVYNRIAGATGEFPFQDAEKEEFIRRIHRLSTLFVIEPISYQVMGNHFHMLVHIPAEPPSSEETAKRYNSYYKEGKRNLLKPDDARCRDIALKLRDISEYMKALQQPYTRWFNRTRRSRRRGHLWADRFKNTVLENGVAGWNCWKYIEMNPVRAYMVSEPSDYRFCSFGRWSATGTHPFEETVKRNLMPVLMGLLHIDDMDGLRTQLKKAFAYHKAVDARKTPDEVDTAIAVAAEKEKFSTKLDRRVRYWVDGLVIGSDIFVRNTVAVGRVKCKAEKRRLTRAVDRKETKQELYSFKQLRVLLE